MWLDHIIFSLTNSYYEIVHIVRIDYQKVDVIFLSSSFFANLLRFSLNDVFSKIAFEHFEKP
uniref:Uncharacterized protein n=1 Tax=Rhizophagus irregularis (strain DAOM 181602 / DAOM 197198 / MUCL 43194) TaxID=747089 RepID=U9T6Y3_RHIID